MSPVNSGVNIGFPRQPVNLQRLGWIALLILCGGLKLFLSAGVELGKDEAAYVYWGQHLDASYALFPFALFGLFHWFAPGAESILRLGPVLFGSASMLLLFRLCRLHPLNVGQALWATAALACSHWFWHTSSYLHPDSPFIACWLLTLVAARQCWRSGTTTVRRLDLLQVGVAAGLTILCKYSGAFLVFGLLLWIPIAHRRSGGWSQLAWVVLPLTVVVAPMVHALLISHFFLPTTLTTLSRIVSAGNLPARLALFALSPLLFVSPLYLFLLYRNLAMLVVRQLGGRAEQRPPAHVLLALLPAVCLLLAFGAFALGRGQIKGNWVLPAFLGLIPYAFASVRQPSARRLLFYSVVITNLIQALSIGLGLRFPGIARDLDSALRLAALNESYSLLVAAPDRRREATYSWTERLCEYRGWRRFAAELEEELTATQMGRDVPLVSHQYGVAFGLDYYGSGKRTHFTVEDPRFSDLSDLYASCGVDLPPEILFVARARTTLPPSLLSRYGDSEAIASLSRRDAGCAPIQYEVHRLRIP